MPDKHPNAERIGGPGGVAARAGALTLTSSW